MTINVQNLQQIASGLPDIVQKALGGALRAQDTLNASVAQQLNALAPGPWQRPQYGNGWTDGSTTRFVQYRQDTPYTARCQGRMTGGTGVVAAFNVGIELAPSQRLGFACNANGAYGQVTVDTNGDVILSAGSTTNVDVNLEWAVAT